MATTIPQTPIIAMSNGMKTLIDEETVSVPMSACNISHSLTNPFIGGIAVRDMAPTNATAERPGRTHASPPNLSIVPSPVTSSMESTVSIINDLNTLWLMVWNSAATVTNEVNAGNESENSIARERHMVTNAMFSMLEYARILFGPVWTMDSIAPQRAVAALTMHNTIATAGTRPDVPTHEKTLLNSINTATLEHTVVNSAVVWVGDREYISGIHAWNGIVPSLVPNPKNNASIRRDDTPSPMVRDNWDHDPMSSVPVNTQRYPKTAMMTNPPICVIMKNLHLGRSLLSAIRNVTKETTSHETNSRMTESAIMHKVHATNSEHASARYPLLYLCPEWVMWNTTIRNTTEDIDTKIDVIRSTVTMYLPRNDSNGNVAENPPV